MASEKDILPIAEAVDRALDLFERAAARYFQACRILDKALRKQPTLIEHPVYGKAASTLHKAVGDRLSRIINDGKPEQPHIVTDVHKKDKKDNATNE